MQNAQRANGRLFPGLAIQNTHCVNQIKRRFSNTKYAVFYPVHCIQGAFNVFDAFLTYLRVAQRSLNIVMAQQLLYKPNIGSVLQQMGRKTMP